MFILAPSFFTVSKLHFFTLLSISIIVHVTQSERGLGDWARSHKSLLWQWWQIMMRVSSVLVCVTIDTVRSHWRVTAGAGDGRGVIEEQEWRVRAWRAWDGWWEAQPQQSTSTLSTQCLDLSCRRKMYSIQRVTAVRKSRHGAQECIWRSYCSTGLERNGLAYIVE